VMIVNFSSLADPKLVEMATSAASRPRAITTRPMRGRLCLASKVNHLNAWRGPQVMSPVETSVSDACPAGVDPRAWAYELGVKEMLDAWKRPPPAVVDVNGPEVAARTQAMEHLPPGRFPMSAGVGSPCDLNGEGGTLQPDGSGYLVCKVPGHLGPSRSGTSSGDAMTREHQGIAGDRATVDAAWQEMVETTANAWRRT
jgi:hypothetical protein